MCQPSWSPLMGMAWLIISPILCEHPEIYTPFSSVPQCPVPVPDTEFGTREVLSIQGTSGWRRYRFSIKLPPADACGDSDSAPLTWRSLRARGTC